jgi:hypothetical protein
LFVYAATAARYIGGEGNPEKRLADVLKLHKGLDPLYTQVIEEARKWDYFDIVMGALMHLQYPLAVDELSTVLLTVEKGLDGPGVHFALAGCRSILNIAGDYNEIKSYHASLQDFLTNQSRSNTLFYPLATAHGQLMVACLGAITTAFNDGSNAPEYALISWYHHACLFLSAPSTTEEVGQLKHEAKEWVKKIDLRWVKLWMPKALSFAGVPYLLRQLPPKMVRE